MKINHSFFSNLAFNLAEKHLGQTKKNPSVGCIVVKDNSVISSGVTSINGRPHAEFNALSKKLDFKNSTMYVTLEPCTHYGLTPPCSKIIKEKKINRVYFCEEDPDKRVYKKAKKFLNKSKIFAKKINLKNNFYKSYFLNKKKGLPLVDAKIAISKDNYTINKKNKWITNSRSRKVGHLLRSRYDCIISTSYTINKDNSLLNCRIKGLNNHKPDLIIIDRHLKLKKKLALFKILNKRKSYILTTSKDKKKINYFKKKKINIIQIKCLSKKDDFIILLKKLFNLGKRRLLVESGLRFLNQLINFRLISDIYVFKSNKKLSYNGINNGSLNFLKKNIIKKKINVNLYEDTLSKVSIK